MTRRQPTQPETELLAALVDMRAAYGRLHDIISDTVESGRLTAWELPDDYQAIVEQLDLCATADAGAEMAIAQATATPPDAPSASPLTNDLRTLRRNRAARA